MTHSKMIGRRQFIKGVATGAVVLTAPYLLLPRKSAFAQVGRSPAFIGAQGFGAGANGWRSPSASILFVTNLNNSGAGSLRQALIGTTGPRYIIFRVAGYITASSRLSMEDSPGDSGSVYIAGQSAPGGGITVRADGVSSVPEVLALRYGHICMRHLRVRQRAGSGGNCIGIAGVGSQSNLILDHISSTWAIADDNFGLAPTVDLVTFQHCLLSESNKALLLYYFDGASGKRVSAHHNYMSHSVQRYPLAQGGNVECINNLSYDWGKCNGPGLGAELTNPYGTMDANYRGNKFRWGPDSGYGLGCDPATAFEIRQGIYPGSSLGGAVYLNDNLAHLPSGTVAARQTVTGDGTLTLLGSPHSFSPPVAVTVHAAANLQDIILSVVGCTKPVRDSVDQAIVDSYAAFTGQSDLSNESQTVGGTPFPTISPGTPEDNTWHLQPSGMTQEFITRMDLANTVASALSTSISQDRGFGEDYQNIEWCLMEQAGDIARLGGGPNLPPAPPTNLRIRKTTRRA